MFETTRDMITTIKVPEVLMVGGGPLGTVKVHTYFDEAGQEWPSYVEYIDKYGHPLAVGPEDRALVEDYFVDLALVVAV
jgi:hypothetical protein